MGRQGVVTASGRPHLSADVRPDGPPAPSTTRHDLAALLRRARTDAGLTQAQVAYAADLAPSTISRHERAWGRPPQLATVAAILLACGHPDPDAEASRWEHVCADTAGLLRWLERELGRPIAPTELHQARREVEDRIRAEADRLTEKLAARRQGRP